jgi:hypothetical protein
VFSEQPRAVTKRMPNGAATVRERTQRPIFFQTWPAFPITELGMSFRTTAMMKTDVVAQRSR